MKGCKDGGTNTIENCQALCLECHRVKTLICKHRRAMISNTSQSHHTLVAN